MVIRSDRRHIGFALGENGEDKIDLDDDGFEDIQINMISRGEGTRSLFVISIHEKICTITDWECTNWSPCVNGGQSRACTAVDCSEDNQLGPPERQSCA